MSFFTNIRGVAPSIPATDKRTLWYDSDRRTKELDEYGATRVLTPMGWRDNNLLVNGEFDFAQRQVPGTLTTYSNTSGRTYTADRFAVTNENVSIQYQRIDTIASPETNNTPRYYGKYKKITGAGKFMVSQVIEAGNMAHLRGKNVRVQMKMKYSVAASLTVRLGLIANGASATQDAIAATFLSAFGGTGVDPTLGTNLTYITPTALIVADGGTVNGNAVDCVLTSAWVRYSAVFTVPATAKNIIVAVWSNAQAAINDELNISEVGLYAGEEIRDWYPRPQAEQLTHCQRYYCKTFNADTAPVQNGGLPGIVRGILGKAAATALAAQLSWRFPVPMRTTPTTITLYNPAAANAQVRQTSGTAADLTVSATANASENAVDITATGAAGGAVGDFVGVHVSAEAEI